MLEIAEDVRGIVDVVIQLSRRVGRRVISDIVSKQAAWRIPMTCHRRCIVPLMTATAFLVAGPALAHTGTGLAGGFVAGFLHPLNGLDHLLAMVAVGLWGAFLGRQMIVALPVIFPTVMAVGGVLGMAGIPLPPVEVGIALSVLVLGGLIAAAVRAPAWVACLIVTNFAIFHGYAHGQELPSAADPTGYSVGFVLSTGLLHVVGIGIGLLNRRPGLVVITRGLGGLIAATGVWFLYQALPS